MGQHSGRPTGWEGRDGEWCSFVPPPHVSDSCGFCLIYRFTSHLISSVRKDYNVTANSSSTLSSSLLLLLFFLFFDLNRSENPRKLNWSLIPLYLLFNKPLHRLWLFWGKQLKKTHFGKDVYLLSFRISSGGRIVWNWLKKLVESSVIQWHKIRMNPFVNISR